jgi:hypothetical protein
LSGKLCDIRLKDTLSSLSCNHAESLELEEWDPFVVDAMTGNRVPDPIFSSTEPLLAIAVEFAAFVSRAFVAIGSRVCQSSLWLELAFHSHFGVARHPMPYKFDEVLVDDRTIVWRCF